MPVCAGLPLSPRLAAAPGHQDHCEPVGAVSVESAVRATPQSVAVVREALVLSRLRVISGSDPRMR